MKKIEDLIYEETVKRLKIMEKKDYKFPSRISKYDVNIIIFLLLINMFLILLCMIGVIK